MTVTENPAVELAADYHISDYALLPAGTRGVVRAGPMPMGSTMKMLVDFAPGISLWVTERAVRSVEGCTIITGGEQR